MEIRYTMRKPPESANITMDRIQEIAKKCGTYPVLVYCLITRGFTEQDILNLFNDKSPLKHLRNADRASYVIAGHLKENHKIEIFADYDVDGITSGYLMYYGISVAKEIIGSTSDISVYYPQREEGYGINIDFCKKAIKNKTNFVITVDNGISKKEEIKYLKDNGIDVLVTDHHEPNKNNIPDCLIVNPCYNDTSRSYLAGVGVVYHVVLELLSSLEEKLNWYDIPMSIVMLGTISDVMPISPENSYFIKNGLDELNNGRGNYFLNKMKEYDTNIEYTPKDISFTVAPRLNAASRMGNTNLGADGFFIKDDDKIQDIIKRLETANKDRKNITDKAKKAIEKLDPKDARIVAFNGKKFKDGTHGIIAGEITKRFEDLVGFVYSEKEPGILSGSVRCNNPNLDLPRLFKEQKDLGNLLSYAGHASACVISVEKKKLKDFVKSFSKSFDSLKLPPVEKKVDAKTNLKMLNDDFLEKLNSIPFTTQELPVFVVPNVLVTEAVPAKSNPNHIQFTLSDNTSRKKVWAWNFAPKFKSLGEPNAVTLICQIEQDFRMKSKTKATLNILDMIPERKAS